MTPSELPVIFTTFANAIDKPAEYLPALGKERQELKRSLSPFIQRGWGRVEESPAAPQYLVENLLECHRQMVIFHFSGHATGEELRLVNEEGDSLDLKKQNLRDILEASIDTLKLVFLNACLTKGIVSELQAIGVPAIVATKVEINDKLAVTFSKTFYKAMVEGQSIRVAFNLARTATNASDVRKKFSFRRDRSAKNRGESSPWKLFGSKEALEWRLKPENLIDERLRKGSLAYFQQLVRKKERFPEELLTPLQAVSKATKKKRNESGESAGGMFGNREEETREPLHTVLSAKDRFGLVTTVRSLWNARYKNTAYLAEGGMRKSAALIRLWLQINASYQHFQTRESREEAEGAFYPIPIYIPLHEYNNRQYSEKGKFISRFISRYYLEERSLIPETEKRLWDWLKAGSGKHPYPKLLLLLDGLDDINVDKSGLLLDIRKEWAEFQPEKGTSPIQILLTGSSSTDFKWATPDFDLIRLLPLPSEQIEAYLNLQLPDQVASQNTYGLRNLLSNPMMLTLYVQYAKNTIKDSGYQENQEISRPGELWDIYIQSLIDKNETQTNGQSIAPYVHKQWQLNHLLPAICFQMEQKGQLEYRRMEFKDAIDTYLNKTRKQLEDYYEVFPESEQIWEKLEQEDPEILIALRLTFSRLSKEQMFLQRKGQRIGFLQQSYRKYFASKHILNELALSLERETIPHILQTYPFPEYLREMIGEILREHKKKPVFDQESNQWTVDRHAETILNQVLEHCRNHFDKELIGFMLWNLLGIWKNSKGDLSGMDLSYLNLSINNIHLNEVRCSRLSPGSDYGYMSARFEGSRLSPELFFPQGHADKITAMTYIPNMRAFMTASLDGTIKIWSELRKSCLNTIESPGSVVTALAHHPSETRFLAGAEDGTVSEWELHPLWNSVAGIKLQTFAAHEKRIQALAYREEGKSFLTIGADHCMKIWYPEKGESSLIRFDQEYDLPLSYLSLVADGEVVLMGFEDGTMAIEGLEEPYPFGAWKASTGGVIGVDLTDRGLISVHKQIIIIWAGAEELKEDGSSELTIEEESRIPVGGEITSFVLAGDGRWIITGDSDGRVQMWDLGSGRLLDQHQVHSGPVTALCANDEWVFSGGQDQLISPFKLGEESLKPRKVLEGHIGAITSLDASDEYLVSGSMDHTARLWAIDSKKKPVEMRLHSSAITSVCIGWEGLLTGSSDGTAILWQVEGDSRLKVKERYRFSGEVAVASLSFHDQKRVLIARKNRMIEIYELAAAFDQVVAGGNEENLSFQLVKMENPHLTACLVSEEEAHSLHSHSPFICMPDRYQIITASKLGFHVSYFDPEAKEMDMFIGQVDPDILHLAAHPTEDRFLSYHANQSIKEWRRVAGARKYISRTIEVSVSNVTALSYLIEGQTFLTACNHGDIHEWAIQSGENMGNFHSQRLRVTGLALSPDTKRFLSVSDDDPHHFVVKEWDLESRSCRYVYVLPEAVITQLAYGPDGRTIFAATNQGQVVSWSSENGKRSHTYSFSASEPEDLLIHCLHLLVDRSGQTTIIAGCVSGKIPVWHVGKEEAVIVHEGSEWVLNLFTGSNPDEFVYHTDFHYLYTQHLHHPDTTSTYHLNPIESRFSAISPDAKSLAYVNDENQIVEEPVCPHFALVVEGNCSHLWTYIQDGVHHCISVLQDPYAFNALAKIEEKVFSEAENSWKTHLSYEGVQQEITAIGGPGPLFYRSTIWATAAKNGSISLWESGNQTPIWVHTAATGEISALAISPDGRYLAYATEGKLHLWADPNIDSKYWSFDSAQQLNIPPIREEPSPAIVGIQFRPDGKRILLIVQLDTVREERDVLEWDIVQETWIGIATQDEAFEEDHADVTACNYSTDSRFLAIGRRDGKLMLWDAQDPKAGNIPNHSWQAFEEEIRFTIPYEANGILSVISISKDGAIKDWRRGEAHPISSEKLPKISSAGFWHSARGFIYSDAYEVEEFREYTLDLGSKILPDRHAPLSTEEHPNPITAIAYNGSGHMLWAAYSSGHIVQWSRINPHMPWEFHSLIEGHAEAHKERTEITALLAYPHPEGERFLSSSVDGTIREWDLKTSDLLHIWPNVPGMWMQGVDLKDVKWARPLSKREKNLLQLYGARMD